MDHIRGVALTGASPDVASHYDTGAMLERIKAGLVALGADPDAPRPEDLKSVDEFHTGGLEATQALLDPLAITADLAVLDLGSGIGGTARFVAQHYGAKVHGVDLTPAFVEMATELTQMTGMSDLCSFQQGSVLDTPPPEARFDLAMMFHVGMNIEDKAALFAQVTGCLKPGGRFALFDVMQGSGAPVDFPVPWSSVEQTSFVAPPQVYRDAAKAAGLDLIFERDRTEYARGFFARVTKAMEDKGPAPLGLHLIMGDQAKLRYANLVQAVFEGKIAPWEMVFAKP